MPDRFVARWFALTLPLLCASVFAQNEPQELEAASVVLVQPPATALDAADGGAGLSVRTITKVGDVPDDAGGTVGVFVVRIDLNSGTVDKPAHDLRAGLALVVTPRGGRPVRAYVDEANVPAVADGLAALTAADRGNGPMTETRAVYRHANLAVYQFDDSGGRTVAVRTLQVAPVTGQATFGVARFRSPRLLDVVRLMRQGKTLLEKK